MDLLLPEVPRKGSVRPADVPKLEIKRDAKGLVSVLGATQQAATSAKQLMFAIEQVGASTYPYVCHRETCHHTMYQMQPGLTALSDGPGPSISHDWLTLSSPCMFANVLSVGRGQAPH